MVCACTLVCGAWLIIFCSLHLLNTGRVLAQALSCNHHHHHHHNAPITHAPGCVVQDIKEAEYAAQALEAASGADRRIVPVSFS